jgi:hemoglobin/transferrin/lactoferrin receptor protein
VAIGAADTDAAAFLVGYAHRAGNELDTAADVTPNPRDYTSDALLAKAEWREMPGGPLMLAAEASLVDQQTSIDAFLGLAGTRFVNSTLLEGDDRRTRSSSAASGYRAMQPKRRLEDLRQARTLSGHLRAATCRATAHTAARNLAALVEDRTLGAEFTAVKDFDRARQTLV